MQGGKKDKDKNTDHGCIIRCFERPWIRQASNGCIIEHASYVIGSTVSHHCIWFRCKQRDSSQETTTDELDWIQQLHMSDHVRGGLTSGKRELQGGAAALHEAVMENEARFATG